MKARHQITSGSFTPHFAPCAPRCRTGFTLIEMLVVIAIIIALAAITLVFLPKRESRLAASGAEQLQTYLASARSRALRDQAPCGVRLITVNGGFRQFQLVQAPDPLAPGVQMTVNANSAAATFAGFSPSGSGVAPGDFLEILHGAGSVHRVADSSTSGVTLSSVPPSAAVASLSISSNYRFILQPKPLMGEPPFQMPESVLVLPNLSVDSSGQANSTEGSLNIPTNNGNFDIIFAPSGQVLNAPGGKIVLWVTDDNRVSKPTLLTIYTRTGAVAAHPLSNYNRSQNIKLGNPGMNDPFQFTYDGRSSGQ